MKINNIKLFFLLNICFLVATYSQEKNNTQFDFGVDFASRYVWRGLGLSDSPVLQPWAELTTGNLTLGVWASYETGGQVVGQEFDLYVSYAMGPVAIGFTDYSFPVDGASDGYFRIKNHIGEALISFDGVEKFPLTAVIAMNVYNDNNNSFYTEIGYPFSIGKIELSAFVGAGNKIYTSHNDFTIINFGFGASKSIKITNDFSLGVSTSAIYNPDTEDAYLVFLISL